MVYSMVNARANFFSRQFGECISVFNPGDIEIKTPLINQNIQNLLNDMFHKNNINFSYSYLAKTNNGVLALMDIKEYNVERLKNYHGIISDGIHKVELTEETIRTLFLGLVNPEDKFHYEKVKSFQDRIYSVNIPYILDYKTEVSIYKNKFGENLESIFLPKVLLNFAKIIVSSRLDKDSPQIRRWIERPEKYSKYMDKNCILLKMEIYTGNIPEWLNDDDLKRFDRPTRKEIIGSSESEGRKGFSGRQSLIVLNHFLNKYYPSFLNSNGNNHNGKSEKLITMEMVKNFFENNKDPVQKQIIETELTQGFIGSLVDMYDYEILQEIKEAIYYYNEDQIARDIMNYLFAINFELGETKKSDYTGDILEISEDYLKNFEALLLGATSTGYERSQFRKDTLTAYITKALAQEIRVENKKLQETEVYSNLFEKYTRSLKENVLAPYLENDNFRRAILDYESPNFNSYDERLKRDVNQLIANLSAKFKYSKAGAIQVCLYALDKNLPKKY